MGPSLGVARSERTKYYPTDDPGERHSGVYAFCLQCRTGTELQITRWINASFAPDEVSAIAPVKILREKRNGVWADVRKPLLPGYVFVYCRHESHRFVSLPDLHMYAGVYKWLQYGEGDRCLRGKDAEYADWIYRHRGVIGSSDVLVTGTTCRVVSWPLKGCMGRIVRIDRHKRKATLEMDFNGMIRRMTLSVNLLEQAQDGQAQDGEKD
ncbi:MAG TPA: hypothetical protein DD727_02235 [Clostridiales bacterium]|nr:hypothetical protein [Clostridiales bacterium]